MGGIRALAQSFAGDAQALLPSQGAVARGWLAAEPVPVPRQFWLMPQVHSEDLAVQDASLARFGRFPHRNAALGRESSAEERAFLQTPGSRF
jgi:uncharacterized protein (DUF924 family)